MDVFTILSTVSTYTTVPVEGYFFIKYSLNCNCWMSVILERLWGNIVLHNKVRIQTVKVKTDHPIIASWYRFFDICPRIFVVLLSSYTRWHHNVTTLKIIVDQGVPHADLRIYILKVYLSVIRHGNCQLDQLHLIFQTVNQINVMDVVFHEALPVRRVEILEVFKLRVVQLLITQLNHSDMV